MSLRSESLHSVVVLDSVVVTAQAKRGAATVVPIRDPVLAYLATADLVVVIATPKDNRDDVGIVLLPMNSQPDFEVLTLAPGAAATLLIVTGTAVWAKSNRAPDPLPVEDWELVKADAQRRLAQLEADL